MRLLNLRKRLEARIISWRIWCQRVAPEHSAYVSDGEISDEPENYRLELPSTFSSESMSDHTLARNAQAELELRQGQASDSLRRLRQKLGLRGAMERDRPQAPGYNAKTRAQTAIKRAQDSARKEADVYRMARKAILLLAPNNVELSTQFQELSEEHLTPLRVDESKFATPYAVSDIRSTNYRPWTCRHCLVLAGIAEP